MTSLVQIFVNSLDHAQGQCLCDRLRRKKGCKVSLEGAPRPRLIIDFDKPKWPRKKGQARCDYLLVFENQQEENQKKKGEWVVPLELKRGRLGDFSEVVKQLQAGAKVAEELLGTSRKSVRFVPIVASKGHHPIITRYRKRRSAKGIKFFDTTHPIEFLKCDAPLVDRLR